MSSRIIACVLFILVIFNQATEVRQFIFRQIFKIRFTVALFSWSPALLKTGGGIDDHPKSSPTPWPGCIIN